jgi:probable dihydroxyacetone kinase regulator
MSDSNSTKRAFAAALKGLMEQNQFDKISVSDICESCGMNRKSFYYHFRDKYDLVNWIFDIEFIGVAGRKKIDEPWVYLGKLCEYFDLNRRFYSRALLIEGPNSFSSHFREMLKPVVSILMQEILKEPKYYEFQIEFYSDAFVGAIERWLFKKNSETPEMFITMLKSCIPYHN